MKFNWPQSDFKKLTFRESALHGHVMAAYWCSKTVKRRPFGAPNQSCGVQLYSSVKLFFSVKKFTWLRDMWVHTACWRKNNQHVSSSSSAWLLIYLNQSLAECWKTYVLLALYASYPLSDEIKYPDWMIIRLFYRDYWYFSFTVSGMKR